MNRRSRRSAATKEFSSADTFGAGSDGLSEQRVGRPTRRVAKLAYLAHNGPMRIDTELSVSQARDHFSDAVNRAAYGGEITFVTRGRGQQRAAAIVPAELVDRYEAMIDSEDGRIAMERLADLDSGRTKAVRADEVARTLGR